MKSFSSLIFALVLLSAPFAQADMVPVNSVVASTSWSTMPPIYLIDGSGLNWANTPPTHSSTDWSTSWESMYYQYAATLTFTFDPTALFNIGSMRIWNFNMVNSYGSYTGRGAKDIDFYTSDNLGASWSLKQSLQLPEAPGLDSYAGFLVTDLGWNGIDAVKFDIKNEWGEGDTGGHVGLSEVQFFSAAAVIDPPTSTPEPCTLALISLGLAGAAFMRRKSTPGAS